MLFYHCNDKFHNVQFTPNFQIILSPTFNPCCVSPLLFSILVQFNTFLLGKGHSWWKTKKRRRCKWVSNSFKLSRRIAGHCYWNPIIGLLSLLLAASVDCNHLAFYSFTFTFPSKYPILKECKDWRWRKRWLVIFADGEPFVEMRKFQCCKCYWVSQGAAFIEPHPGWISCLLQPSIVQAPLSETSSSWEWKASRLPGLKMGNVDGLIR